VPAVDLVKPFLARDRIIGLRRVRAGNLFASPQNWRTHPAAQIDALQGVLQEIGYADALIARSLADGELELIDGHARKELDPEQIVPVLVVDLNQEEANKLLTVLDPLAAMAESNKAALESLLQEMQTDNAAVQTMLDGLAKNNKIAMQEAVLPTDAGGQPVEDSFSVVVQCSDEADQKALYERLTEEGRTCRPLTL